MKRLSYTLLVAVLASMMFTSCLQDNDKTEYSDKCEISSFSLGYIKRIHHIMTDAGKDSIYTTSFAGSSFTMDINQRTQHIENRDSLPYGAVISNVLTTCTFSSVLVHRPKDITGLAPADTAWVTYSSSDSIDYTNPREFLVFPSDGNSCRYYTVKVNVHQMDPDATVWDSLGVSALAAPKAGEVRKMAVLNGTLKLLMQQADGTVTCLARAAQKGGEWKEQSLTGVEGIDLSTFQNVDGTLYASTNDGKIIYSVDGTEWRTRMVGLAGLRLAGVSQSRIYAFADGKLMSSAQGSEAWTEEKLDEGAEKLPVKDLSMMTFTQKNDRERLLLMGKSADGQAARLWSKTWVKESGSEDATMWAYYSENGAIRYPYPLLQQSSVMPYGGDIIMFGGASEPNTGDCEALGTLYCSQDYGISWKQHALMTLADEMKETAQKAQTITSALENGRYIWVLIDGQLWRGRLNSLLFN